MNKTTRSPRIQPKRGVMLVIALVCLLVVMTVIGQMLLSVVRTGRQWKVERDRRQCELLLQAGVNRGLRQLGASPDYTGGTHELPAEQIIGQDAGRLTIEVMRPSMGEARQLRVLAEYPLDGERSVRRSRVLQLQANSTSSEE